VVKDRSASSEQLAFLFQVFAQISEPDEIEALMIDLCTIREMNEMATRLDVAKLLAQGESYLKISELTGASATTIARVSKCINHGAGGYQSVFKLGDATTEKLTETDTVISTGSTNPATGGR
jgi:TrpR-related protein YerC/YecD